MKSKALLVAALPVPFDGPWVSLEEAAAWRVDPEGDYGDAVRIEVEEGYFDGKIVAGKKVRACIVHDIPGHPHVSVCIEEVTMLLSQVGVSS